MFFIVTHKAVFKLKKTAMGSNLEKSIKLLYYDLLLRILMQACHSYDFFQNKWLRENLLFVINLIMYYISIIVGVN